MRGQARDYDGWGAGDGSAPTPAGAGTSACPTSCKHEDFYKGADAFHAAPGFDPTGSGRAANGGSRSSACTGRSSTPSRRPRSRGRHAAQRRLQPRRQRRRRLLRGQPARRHRAGTRPRRSCARLLRAARTCRCGPARTSTASCFDGRPRDRRRDRAARRRRAGARRSSRRAARWCSRPAAIGTPQILQLSGIGPGRAAAASTASRSRVDLPGVGANLQDHLQIRAVYGVEGAQDAEHDGGDAAGARR